MMDLGEWHLSAFVDAAATSLRADGRDRQFIAVPFAQAAEEIRRELPRGMGSRVRFLLPVPVQLRRRADSGREVAE